MKACKSANYKATGLAVGTDYGVHPLPQAHHWPASRAYCTGGHHATSRKARLFWSGALRPQTSQPRLLPCCSPCLPSPFPHHHSPWPSCTRTNCFTPTSPPTPGWFRVPGVDVDCTRLSRQFATDPFFAERVSPRAPFRCPVPTRRCGHSTPQNHLACQLPGLQTSPLFYCLTEARNATALSHFCNCRRIVLSDFFPSPSLYLASRGSRLSSATRPLRPWQRFRQLLRP